MTYRAWDGWDFDRDDSGGVTMTREGTSYFFTADQWVEIIVHMSEMFKTT